MKKEFLKHIVNLFLLIVPVVFGGKITQSIKQYVVTFQSKAIHHQIGVGRCGDITTEGLKSCHAHIYVEKDMKEVQNAICLPNQYDIYVKLVDDEEDSWFALTSQRWHSEREFDVVDSEEANMISIDLTCVCEHKLIKCEMPTFLTRITDVSVCPNGAHHIFETKYRITGNDLGILLHFADGTTEITLYTTKEEEDVREIFKEPTGYDIYIKNDRTPGWDQLSSAILTATEVKYITVGDWMLSFANTRKYSTESHVIKHISDVTEVSICTKGDHYLLEYIYYWTTTCGRLVNAPDGTVTLEFYIPDAESGTSKIDSQSAILSPDGFDIYIRHDDCFDKWTRVSDRISNTVISPGMEHSNSGTRYLISEYKKPDVFTAYVVEIMEVSICKKGNDHIFQSLYHYIGWSGCIYEFGHGEDTRIQIFIGLNELAKIENSNNYDFYIKLDERCKEWLQIGPGKTVIATETRQIENIPSYSIEFKMFLERAHLPVDGRSLGNAATITNVAIRKINNVNEIDPNKIDKKTHLIRYGRGAFKWEPEKKIVIVGDKSKEYKYDTWIEDTENYNLLIQIEGKMHVWYQIKGRTDIQVITDKAGTSFCRSFIFDDIVKVI